MKFTALTIIPFLIAFASCSKTNKLPANISAVQSKQPKSNENQSSLPESPQKACSDALPNNISSYPVAFYPVFVEYDEKHLELMKKHFCEDARKITREKTGKDVMQVGSFISQERANQLKEKLMKYFSGVEVGEPTTVRAALQTESKESISRSAGLTSDQAAQLVKIVGVGKDFETQDVVVLPTTIPDGYRVAHFAV